MDRGSSRRLAYETALHQSNLRRRRDGVSDPTALRSEMPPHGMLKRYTHHPCGCGQHGIAGMFIVQLGPGISYHVRKCNDLLVAEYLVLSGKVQSRAFLRTRFLWLSASSHG